MNAQTLLSFLISDEPLANSSERGLIAEFYESPLKMQAKDNNGLDSKTTYDRTTLRRFWEAKCDDEPISNSTVSFDIMGNELSFVSSGFTSQTRFNSGGCALHFDTSSESASEDSRSLPDSDQENINKDGPDNGSSRVGNSTSRLLFFRREHEQHQRPKRPFRDITPVSPAPTKKLGSGAKLSKKKRDEEEGNRHFFKPAPILGGHGIQKAPKSFR